MKITPKFQITNVDNKFARGKAVFSPVKLRKMRKQDNITTIIDLRNSMSFDKILERIFCSLTGIKYINCKYKHRLNVIPEKNFFDKINEIILNNPERTYVHCQNGKRRTGIVAAYYEKVHLNEPDETIIDNLIKQGYSDVFEPSASKRLRRYAEIFDDFCKTYLGNKTVQ